MSHNSSPLLRDPDVIEVTFSEGTTSLCSDTAVFDGIAECTINWSSWPSGEYIIEINATTSALNQHRIYVLYDVL